MLDLLSKIESAELSDASKATYRKIARALIKTCARTSLPHSLEQSLSKGEWGNENDALYDIIMNIKKYQPLINEVENLKALDIYYNTIRALIKHSGDKKLNSMKSEWDVYANVIGEKLREQTDNRFVSDKQKNGSLRWVDVLMKLSELEKGSMDHLLLCTYVEFTRRQSDYASIKIYKSPNANIDNSCYIHLKPPESAKPYIRIGLGKTKKHYGDFECELPKILLDSIRVSLKNDPRDYLFGDKTVDGFRLWCNKVLKRLFKNKDVTVNSLRHSHAEYIDNKPGITPGERKLEAWKMGHSVMKQLEYNLNLNNKKEVCYRMNPSTKKLEAGECIFYDNEPLEIKIPY